MRSELAAATEAIGRLRALQDRGSCALARHCRVGNALDAEKQDEQQVACFELAWAAAELIAAQASLACSLRTGSSVDARLANVFAADAFVAAGSRIEGILLGLGEDLAALRELQCAADVLAWRRDALSTAALRAAGQAVIDVDADVGQLALDEPHVLALESFRRFAREEVEPLAAAIHRDDLTVPEALLGPLREMGVFGLSIPERFGGSAPDDRDDTLLMLLVTEALSEGSLGAAGSLITRPEILCRALLAGGTEAQKRHWLPRLAVGQPLCAIAMTEPDHGSDVASITLRASRTEGGWLLHGAKTWCTFAGKAGVLMVVARTNPDASLGHRGLSIFLVEKPSHDGHEFDLVQGNGMPRGGHLSGRAISTIGYRGMHSFDLSFVDFFVSDANLLGEAAGEGKGFYYTMAGMLGGRLQTSARACGVMRAALRAAVRYSLDRRVFGAPLAQLPLTLAKLARMGARLAACRQLGADVALLVDRGEGRMEASLVKLLSCRSAEWVTREAMQLHGGMGYAEETPASRYFVDARVLSIFEGAEETLALKVVARSLLEQALRS